MALSSQVTPHRLSHTAPGAASAPSPSNSIPKTRPQQRYGTLSGAAQLPPELIRGPRALRRKLRARAARPSPLQESRNGSHTAFISVVRRFARCVPARRGICPKPDIFLHSGKGS
jgi:hypothetical protein